MKYQAERKYQQIDVYIYQCENGPSKIDCIKQKLMDSLVHKVLFYFQGLDTKLCGIFPSRTRGIYFTRSNFLTVYFKSDEGEKYTGFDMVITRYRYGKTSFHGSLWHEHKCLM